MFYLSRSESIDDKYMNGRKHFLQINFPPMRALEFITGDVIFKQLCYNQIYKLKTTMNK